MSSKIEISRLTLTLRRHVYDTFASHFLSASFTFLNRVFQLLHTLPLLPFLDCMVSCEFSPTREALENESIELSCVKSRTFINISTLKRCFKNKTFIRITRFHVKVPYNWDQECKLVYQRFMWCNFLFRLPLKEASDSERLPRRFRFVFPLCFLWQHASKSQKLICKNNST